MPSSNAIAAQVLARLSFHLDRPEWLRIALEAIEAFGEIAGQPPLDSAASISVLDSLTDPPIEIAIFGERGSPECEALHAAVAQRYLPNRVMAEVDPSRGETAASVFAADRRPTNERATLYVCRNGVCAPPFTSAEGVDLALREA